MNFPEDDAWTGLDEIAPNAEPLEDYYGADRIVGFALSADRTRLWIQEQCDEWFRVSLSAADVDALIAWLQSQRALMFIDRSGPA